MLPASRSPFARRAFPLGFGSAVFVAWAPPAAPSLEAIRRRRVSLARLLRNRRLAWAVSRERLWWWDDGVESDFGVEIFPR
jgi:hypothetical protein